MNKRFLWMAGAILAVGLIIVIVLANTGGGTPEDGVESEAGSETQAEIEADDETQAGTEADGEAEGEGDASWTVLVYVMGDTDLEPFALDDLTEMASVGSSDELNIVAMVDRSPDYSSDGLLNLDDWESTKLLEVDQDELVEVADLGELNTGDPDTLAAFVETGLTEYPADNYAVVLWDHGGGWTGMGADETNDEDGLGIDEIAQGLDEGMAAAGVSTLDLLGFDACLMATYEVASTLAPYADYMVASEELEPGHGWNYAQLAVIEENPETDAPALASALLEGFSAQAADEDTGSDITLGLIDLAAMGDLQAAMEGLAGAYLDDPGAYTPDLASAQQDVLSFGRDPDPEFSTYQIDLGGMLDNLVANGDETLSESATAASEALDAVVVEHVAGPATSASTGLSIYFPPLESYFEPDYLDLEGVPTWPGTLSEFFTSGSLLDGASRAVFDDETELEATFEDGELGIFVPLAAGTEDSVVEMSVAVGFEDEGDSVYVIEIPAYLDEQDGRTGLQADYDLTFMSISDGVDEHLVYQSIGVDPDTGLTVIDIPLDYVAPGSDPDEFEDLLLSIVVDEDGTILEEEFYSRDVAGILGAFQPQPDGLLFPVALVSTADGEWVYERTGSEGIWADVEVLEYFLDEMPSGTVLDLDVTVRDYAGTGDFEVFAVDVP